MLLAVIFAAVVPQSAAPANVTHHVCLSRGLRWLPPQLKPYWWEPLPSSDAIDGFRGQCEDVAARRGCLHTSGGYGRLNNELLSFVNMIKDSISGGENQFLRLTPSAFIGDILAKHFPSGEDALRSWVCFADDPSTCNHTHDVGAGDAVHGLVEDPKHRARTMGSLHTANFAGAVASQIFLNANGKLRAAVDRFDAMHNLSCRGFVAAHLRNLEGQCTRRAQSAFTAKGPNIVVPDWKAYEAAGLGPADVCRMSDRLISYHNPRNKTLLILHDRQDEARVAELKQAHDVLVYEGEDGVLVDMLLALRADHFFGNPVSSLSAMIMLMRQAAVDSNSLRRPLEVDLIG